MRAAHALPAAVLLALLHAPAVGRAAQVPADEPARITEAARSLRPGEVVVLTISLAAAADSVRVRALGRDIPAFRVRPDTWQALLGLDIDARPGRDIVSADVRQAGRERRATRTLVVQPYRFPTRTLRVDPAFVTPPPEEETRILDEAKRLSSVLDVVSPARMWSGPFVHPVSAAPTGRFGARSIFNGEPRSPHAGEDFPSPTGTPVAAPNAGRVVLAHGLYFGGNTIVIDHGLGMFSLLEHLSAIDVHEGDMVQSGQIVGRVGATGRVTGPHLHWAVRLNGARVDPLSVLATVH